jgi:DNA-binding CsgD family transcriptional regulator
LCFARSINQVERKNLIRQRVRSELSLRIRGGEKVSLISGRRQYLCWTLPLEPFSRRVQNTTIAIILARGSRVAGHLRRSCEQYKLTRRECEAVRLLSEGLTSKQIARRMNISAHTVKAFLHLIMLKLRVATRSGIVGKLNSQVADEQTHPANNPRVPAPRQSEPSSHVDIA